MWPSDHGVFLSWAVGSQTSVTRRVSELLLTKRSVDNVTLRLLFIHSWHEDRYRLFHENAKNKGGLSSGHLHMTFIT